MFFSKYSASGNDFIIMHTFKFQENSYASFAREICHRQKGIGADGFIVLKPHEIYDLQWEFYNADGSCANMCGNGTRAAGIYARDLKLAGERQTLLTKAGVIQIELNKNMAESELTKPKVLQTNIQEFDIQWWLIDTGVPHLVCENANLPKEDLQILRYKYNANVNIATIMQDCVLARTFERGVEDETLACGTGMAAMFYYLLMQKKIPNHMKFIPASQEEIFLKEYQGKLFLKGNVKKICDFIYPIG